MILGEVCGTVVATAKADRVDRGRYLLVAPAGVDGTRLAAASDAPLVTLDLVGANAGQLVLVSQGSSARNTLETSSAAVDAVIVGIVDEIDVRTR